MKTTTRPPKATKRDLRALDEFLIEGVRDRLAGTLRLRIPLGTSLREIEMQIVVRTLAIVRGNVTKCAEALQIDRRTTYRYLKAAKSKQRRKR